MELLVLILKDRVLPPWCQIKCSIARVLPTVIHLKSNKSKEETQIKETTYSGNISLLPEFL